MELVIFGLLGLLSVFTLTFILERLRALRRSAVIPDELLEALEDGHDETDLQILFKECDRHPSSLGRLLQVAGRHLKEGYEEASSILEARARQEINRLERGLVILEIATGVAPLLGLIGTIYGMMDLFGELGGAQQGDQAVFARGIALALRATMLGLLIAIPALVSWSALNRRVETYAIELEGLCEEFLVKFARRRQGLSAAPGARVPLPTSVPPSSHGSYSEQGGNLL